jgi:hypothetical protein
MIQTKLLSQLVDSMGNTIPSATIQSGDKLFSMFTYHPTGFHITLASDIMVVAGTDGNGNRGIEFDGLFTTDPGTSSDAALTYKVEVTGSSLRIHDAHLFGNPNVVGSDMGKTGSLTITETFSDENGVSLNSNKMTIYDDTSVGGRLSDMTTFDSKHPALFVTKDIGILGGTGRPTLSILDQTFSQITNPEPSTIALVVAGLPIAGILALRRRKAKA